MAAATAGANQCAEHLLDAGADASGLRTAAEALRATELISCICLSSGTRFSSPRAVHVVPSLLHTVVSIGQASHAPEVAVAKKKPAWHTLHAAAEIAPRPLLAARPI